MYYCLIRLSLLVAHAEQVDHLVAHPTASASQQTLTRSRLPVFHNNGVLLENGAFRQNRKDKRPRCIAKAALHVLYRTLIALQHGGIQHIKLFEFAHFVESGM